MIEQNSIDELLAWFYIFGVWGAAAITAVVIGLVVSFIVYLNTGVHVKDWIEEKFPN